MAYFGSVKWMTTRNENALVKKSRDEGGRLRRKNAIDIIRLIVEKKV